jgi:hypothetical protein
VQINSWVKLTVEIFTRLKHGVELESILTKFNENKFDFTLENQSVSSEQPLTITRDIYLNSSLLMNGEFLVLNAFMIKLKDKPLQFSI